MTINAYRIFGDESPVPLTVFAHDAQSAEAIYGEWIMRHMPGRAPKPKSIEECDEGSLSEFPQLAEAVHDATSKDTAGVGYWLGHRGGWFVQPPHAPRLGELGPFVSGIECYVFVHGDADDRILVFAHDQDHANELFSAWHEAAFGRPFEHVLFKWVSRWLLTDDQVTLREEMDIGMTGIAGWSPMTGWHIYAPDHEMACE